MPPIRLSPNPSWQRRPAAELAGQILESIAAGRLARLPLRLRFWDGSTLTAPGAGQRPPTVIVRRRAVAHLLRRPDQIGLARAWVDGSLGVEGDLEEVLALRSQVDDVSLTAAERLRLLLGAVRAAGPRILLRPPVPAIEASTINGERHSPERDRVTVRHHYDVSNDFYRLVLGPSLVYSCAYFTHAGDPLEEAQERKLELICRKLRLSPGERLLDIGCGWGSLVLHAAAEHGVRAVGITLSEPQAQLARERAREAGLSDRVEIRVADYREVSDGPYDKVASVGMYEHVGRDHLDAYVDTVTRLLRPGGLFLNHGIARLASAPPQGDTFISRYVFPDGELHPVGDLIVSLQRAGLEVRDVESLRDHYPPTLRRWVTNLRGRRDEALALVGDQRVRAWELYMLASAQAFELGEIAVYQVLAAAPGAPHGLPLDRLELLRGERRAGEASAADGRGESQAATAGGPADAPTR